MRPRFLIATAVLFAAAGGAAAQSAPVVVKLGLGQEFYYAGDPLSLQISVRNNSPEKQANPVRKPLLRGFRVRAGGGDALEPGEKSDVAEPARPEELASGAFYGTVLDISQLFPQLREVGTYEIYWSGDGLISEMLVVTIIPRYDPSKDYVAELETSLGSIVIDLYEKQSPIAAKSFVDMAHTGVFDGLLFQEAHPDQFVVGGDPVFSKKPRRTVQFPAERSTIPLVAGTVALKPVNAAPMANSSTFMILLRPQPNWAGQVTVLGQVIRGLDIVRQISQVPTSGRSARPFFKPVEDVRILKVTIRENRPPGQPS